MNEAQSKRASSLAERRNDLERTFVNNYIASAQRCCYPCYLRAVENQARLASAYGEGFDAGYAAAVADHAGLVAALNFIVNDASSFGLESEPYVEIARAALESLTKGEE